MLCFLLSFLDVFFFLKRLRKIYQRLVERVLLGLHMIRRLFKLRYMLVAFVMIAKTWKLGLLGRFAFFDVSVYAMFRWD